MADTFTKTTHTGWGKRIVNSIAGVLFGLLMFVASFVVIYMNEGRVDLSELAKDASVLDPAVVASEVDHPEGMVSLTGDISSEEGLGDGKYLKSGDYVAYRRIAEMYAWEEEEETESETHVGGSETTTTTYTYRKTWTEDPENSSNFEVRTGHENPEMTIKSGDGTVEEAGIGAYMVNMQGIDVRGLEPLRLDDTVLTLTDDARLDGGYVFKGTGSASSPEIGDIRVSYEVIRDGTNSTVFGKLDGDTIGAYYDDGTKLHYLYTGTRDAALGNMHQEYLIALWVVRALGFILMWLGMMMVLGPISVFLDVLPIMGKVSRSAIGIVTFLVALVLSVVTMVVSKILHNPIALIIVLAVAVAGGVYWFKRHRKSGDEAAASGPAAATGQPAAPAPPVNPQLADYVVKSRQAGMDDASIRQSLVGAGWPADQVDAAIRSGGGAPPPPPPQM